MRKVKKSKELKVRILNANSLALFISAPYTTALRQIEPVLFPFVGTRLQSYLKPLKALLSLAGSTAP
jgi:hypothetical protein